MYQPKHCDVQDKSESFFGIDKENDLVKTSVSKCKTSVSKCVEEWKPLKGNTCSRKILCLKIKDEANYNGLLGLFYVA